MFDKIMLRTSLVTSKITPTRISKDVVPKLLTPDKDKSASITCGNVAKTARKAW